MRIVVVLLSLIFNNSFSKAQDHSEKYFFDKEGNKTDSLRAAYYSIYRFDDAERKGCTVISYSMNNIIKSERHYSDLSIEQVEGISKFYYQNGDIKSEINYRNRKLNGRVKIFNQSGKLIRNDLFDNGNFISGNCYTADGKDTIHYNYEIMPQFIGGNNKLYEFLMENIKYPKEAKRKNISGKVIVKFTIDKNGEIENPMIFQSVDPLLDMESLRVVDLMPAWIPGDKFGEPVEVPYYLPINFNLN